MFKRHDLWTLDKVPKDLSEVIGNKIFIDSITTCISKNKMPNLLLYGSAGVGKKLIAKLIAKKYGGETKCIDATIHKGKDIVVINTADKESSDCINITTFAKAKCKAEFDFKKKVIIITNFDEMTKEAQNALRSIIEKYMNTTRFILTSNDLNGIIEPLQSRFNIFCIKALSIKNIKAVINTVIIKPLCPKVINFLIMITEGDIKQIINYIQAISYHDNMTVETFTTIFKMPNIVVIKELIKDIVINYRYDKEVLFLYDPQSIKFMFTRLIIKYYDKKKYNINYDFISIVIKSNLKICHTEKEIIISIITLFNKLIYANSKGKSL